MIKIVKGSDAEIEVSLRYKGGSQEPYLVPEASTVKMFIKNPSGNLELDGTVDAEKAWRVTFPITSAQSATLKAGTIDFEIEIATDIGEGNIKTKIVQFLKQLEIKERV